MNIISELTRIISSLTPFEPGKEAKLVRVMEKHGDHLMEKMEKAGLVSENQLLTALSQLFDIPFDPSLTLDPLDLPSIRDLSPAFLKRSCMVPVSLAGNRSAIALNNPIDLSASDDLDRQLGSRGMPLILAPRQAILSAVNTLFESKNGDNAMLMVEELEETEFQLLDGIPETRDLLDSDDDAPIIRLVNYMISQAAKIRASDIHIEPFKNSLRIRFRIDGILYEQTPPPRAAQPALVSRIKVMAGMNIAEKRVPQDGRSQVRIGNQEIDLRISTIPTGYGERVVIRLLNKSGYFMSLAEFGMPEGTLEHIRAIIGQTHGIVLVTGPTGSGKTTTLYAGLSEINSPEKNIITIEDPVEYNLEGIGQIQVNPKIGMTFAKGLRSVVRQDPDVILVGEIRDIETASIAIQSALTGHLVFSTLHTNDAPSAVTRLADLGVEPYLVSSSVNTVIAQRLVRVLCTQCRRATSFSTEDATILGLDPKKWAGRSVFTPQGCPACFNTGYLGRQPIFEILDMDDGIKSMIMTTSHAGRIRDIAMEKGMVTLRRDGLNKVLQGITSVEEVLRVTQS